MSENELNWKRKEYDTWDDAFRGLAPAVRQQSVRVAAYTRALYVTACAKGFGGRSEEATERIRGQYADLAYKCGMYHQLGKALVPPEYQIPQKDFTREERMVYRKYTTDGAQLVASLQERALRARDKRAGKLAGVTVQNIPDRMIQEACQQHMERWDGSGYPQGRKEGQISPIAQIVGLAKELDHLVSDIKSEHPFEDAYIELAGQAGTLWSNELIAVLNEAKPACQEVYEKYIHYTMTIPETIPLVPKRANRPMGLRYRPMISDAAGTVAAFEASPWFGGIAERDGETEESADVEELLRRAELVAGVSNYLFYEATDTIVRINNCKLKPKLVLLNVLPDFYKLNNQLQSLQKVFKDQNLSQEQLILVISESMVVGAGKGRLETIGRYLRNGIGLLLDQYHPEELAKEQLIELGIRYVRFAPELYGRQETANAMKALAAEGITLVGGAADTPEIVDWLLSNGVAYLSGTMTGMPVEEEELIRDQLLRERMN